MTLQLPDINFTRLFAWLTGVFRGKEAMSLPTLKPYNLFTSINDLPFSQYKRLTIDDNTEALIMPSGTYDRLSFRDIRQVHSDIQRDSILAEAAERVKEQFEEALGGEEIKDLIGSVWTLESLNAKINRLKDYLLLFLQYPSEAFVELFKAEGFDYSTADLNEYAQRVRNRIASYEMQLEQKKALYEKHYGENEVFTPTYEYYADIMAEIRKIEGWAVPDTISTLDFCTYYNRLRKHYERQKIEHGRSVG